MNTLSHYKNFVNEADNPVIKPEKSKFVKGEKKLLKLFISPKLEGLLRKMMKTADFQSKSISSKILNIDQESDMLKDFFPNAPDENLFDISYIDVDGDKDDSLSFMPSQRAWFRMGFKDQVEANKKPDPGCEMWTGAGRQSLGVGKFINRLFDNFSDKAIDSFVKSYKAEIAAIMIYDRFKLVTGEDIRFWYAESNYYKCPSGGSGKDAGLNNSCMKYDSSSKEGKNSQPYFDIYTNNPEKCAMLILTNAQDKLLGRAIVWSNLRKPRNKTFMDRIYVFKQSDTELFKKYAIEKGWLYKYEQQAYDASYIENGQRVSKSIALQLKPAEYKFYPFMDTLKYYNPGTGRLGSDSGNPVEGMGRLKLENGNGRAEMID